MVIYKYFRLNHGYLSIFSVENGYLSIFLVEHGYLSIISVEHGYISIRLNQMDPHLYVFADMAPGLVLKIKHFHSTNLNVREILLFCL